MANGKTYMELADSEKLDLWIMSIEERMELGELLSLDGMGRLKDDLEGVARRLRQMDDVQARIIYLETLEDSEVRTLKLSHLFHTLQDDVSRWAKNNLSSKKYDGLEHLIRNER